MASAYVRRRRALPSDCFGMLNGKPAGIRHGAVERARRA